MEGFGLPIDSPGAMEMCCKQLVQAVQIRISFHDLSFNLKALLINVTIKRPKFTVCLISSWMNVHHSDSGSFNMDSTVHKDLQTSSLN